MIETQLPGVSDRSWRWQRSESTCPPEGADKAQPGGGCLLKYGPNLAGASDFFNGYR